MDIAAEHTQGSNQRRCQKCTQNATHIQPNHNPADDNDRVQVDTVPDNTGHQNAAFHLLDHKIEQTSILNQEALLLSESKMGMGQEI